MNLYYDKHAKDPTYYVHQSVRKDGKVTSEIVHKIGKHSELLKEHSDPLAYARQVVQEYNDSTNVTLTKRYNLDKPLPKTEFEYSDSTTLNIGYLYLNQIYRRLKIDGFMDELASHLKAKYDLAQVHRLLTVDRIMSPASKRQNVLNQDQLFEDSNFAYQHVMRYMSALAPRLNEYIAYLFHATNKTIERDTTVCFYDCTNFYFKIDKEDKYQYDIQYQNQNTPLVEMGLFIDKDGIPITMTIAPGNKSEQLTAVPLEKELLAMCKNKKLVYVADAGLGSYNIRKFNAMGGRHFVVTQSIKKLPNVLQQAVFNDFDYKLLSSNRSIKINTLKTFDLEANEELFNDKAYKVVDASKELVMGFEEEKITSTGKVRTVKAKATLHQKLIITFSRKMMEYQRSIRNEQINRAKELLKHIDAEKYKKGPNDITRFIKRKTKSQITFELDTNRIEEEEKYDGYYAIATNLDSDISEVLAIMDQRNKIEDCFRVMKTDFSARPVYHSLDDHIKVHFAICYTALLIFRILETELNRAGLHTTAANLITTMKNMTVTQSAHDLYTPNYTHSKALEALETVYKLGLDKEAFNKKRLEKLVKGPIHTTKSKSKK